jgi:hypothetical protein
MKILLLLALLYSQTGISQDIEFYAGLNINRTYISGETSSQGVHRNKNSLKPGYRIAVSIPFKLKGAGMKVGVSLIDYSGKFAYGQLGNYGPYPYYGFSSGDTYQADYHNQTINLEYYPVNLQFDNKLEIAVGVNAAFRIHSKIDGNRNLWSDSSTPAYPSAGGFRTFTPIENTIGSKVNFGVLLNILYVHQLKNGWKLVPQFHTNFYFIEDYTDHSKWMNMVGFGFRKSLGSPEPK